MFSGLLFTGFTMEMFRLTYSYARALENSSRSSHFQARLLIALSPHPCMELFLAWNCSFEFVCLIRIYGKHWFTVLLSEKNKNIDRSKNRKKPYTEQLHISVYLLGTIKMSLIFLPALSKSL